MVISVHNRHQFILPPPEQNSLLQRPEEKEGFQSSGKPFLLLKRVPNFSLSRYLQRTDISTITVYNFARSILSKLGIHFTVVTNVKYQELRNVRLFLLGEIHLHPAVIKANTEVMRWLFAAESVVLTESDILPDHVNSGDLIPKLNWKRWDIDILKEEIDKIDFLNAKSRHLLQRLYYMMKHDLCRCFHCCNGSNDSFEKIATSVNGLLQRILADGIKSYELSLKSYLGENFGIPYWEKFSHLYNFKPIEQKDFANPFKIFVKVETIFRYALYLESRWIDLTHDERQGALIGAIRQSLSDKKKVFVIAGTAHLYGDCILKAFLRDSAVPYILFHPKCKKPIKQVAASSSRKMTDLSHLKNTEGHTDSNTSIRLDVLQLASLCANVMKYYNREGNKLANVKATQAYTKIPPDEFGDHSLP